VPKPSTSVGEDGTNGTNGTNGTPKKGRAIAVPRPRHFEPDKDRALRAYLRHGTIVAGCKAAKVGRSTWYRWIDEDRAFAAAVAEVREEVADALEAEAIKRAKKGSDVLLIFLLKNKRRREFGERGPDRTGTITKHDLELLLQELAEAAEKAVRATVLDSAIAVKILERLGHEWLAVLAARYPDIDPAAGADRGERAESVPPERQLGGG
jgi:hypothetical protein